MSPDKTKEGFDVVCVLGHISPSPDGTESATLAAFRLIAEHDAPGEYTFPNGYGGTTFVTVAVPPADYADDDRR